MRVTQGDQIGGFELGGDDYFGEFGLGRINRGGEV